MLNTYSPSMRCGECLFNNFTYCIRGPMQLVSDAPPSTYCCQNTTNCTMIKDPAWNCSSSISDPFLKYRVCPFIPTQCGKSNVINLNGTGDQLCLKISKLLSGNVCLYNVNSACQQANFTFNDTSNFYT